MSVSMTSKKDVWGIKVKFKNYEKWSIAYTYKSLIKIEEGDVVVVPTGNFYQVGKVTKSVANPPFKEKDSYYKFVIQKVEVDV